MKRLIPLLIALSAATPALAQAYDPQAEADRTRAELRAYGAQADAQAAAAAANQAQTQATLRRLEADRVRTVIRPDVYDPQSAAATADQQAQSADRQAADAALRNLDAQLQQMDAYLNQARPK